MATQIINGVVVERVEASTNFGDETIGSVLETHDVIPLTQQGMARAPLDKGNGVELSGSPAAAGEGVVALPNAVGANPTTAEYNALLAALRANGAVY